MLKETGTVGAVIVAAGKGSRMGLGYNKVLADLCGRPIIDWTLDSFINSGLVDRIVLVISPEDQESMLSICGKYENKIDLSIVVGGLERQDSVYKGLIAFEKNTDIVLIHDGARPFIDQALIKRSIDYAHQYGCACAGTNAKDTIKIVDEKNIVQSTPKRELVWNAQTPQSFKYAFILDAYEKARKLGIRGTDDAAIAEAAGAKVVMFEGSYRNIKLTSYEDMILAEQFIRKF